MTRRFAILIGIVALASAARAAPSDTDAFDGLVARAMERWEVPAVAVAAVDRERVLMSRVYGRRNAEDGLPTTPRTLFAMGSIAKSFTVVALARQSESGALDWDAPASRYLPELRLQRIGNARAVSVRDLVAHRSGMHRHDALWYLHAYSRMELVRRLRYLAPFAPPGKAFQYSNLMVAAAGLVAARISGVPWETLVRDAILEPARLRDTRLSLAEFAAQPDRATGYFPGDDGRIRIPPRDTTAIAPAAAVYSSLRDMTRWLRFFVAGGVIDERRIVGTRALAALLVPRIGIPDAPGFDELGPVAYGMGFYVTTYRGRKLARHPGVIDGYAALLTFMPEHGFGVVVLTNRSGANPAPAVLSYAIYDRLLGLEPVSWIDRFPSVEQSRAARRAAAPGRKMSTPTPMTLDSESYAGFYRHPAYGTIEISGAGAALRGRLHDITFPLRHVGGDEWEVAELCWPLRMGLRMRFRIGPSGTVQALATPLADGPTYRHNPGDLVFVRLPARPLDPNSPTGASDQRGGEDAERHR